MYYNYVLVGDCVTDESVVDVPLHKAGFSCEWFPQEDNFDVHLTTTHVERLMRRLQQFNNIQFI